MKTALSDHDIRDAAAPLEASLERFAKRCGREVAAGMANGTLPPFIGIRIKTFSQDLMRRSIRTLDIFVSSMLDAAGKLPPWFVVTLPKIQLPEQVTLLIDLFERLEP